MDSMQIENEIWFVDCTETGLIKVENKADAGKSFEINLFNEHFRYLYAEWDVVPKFFLTPDSRYLIVTYGIGYIYFILLSEKRLVKTIQLFDEISYDGDPIDDVVESIDTFCYYTERTQIDFSSTGQYAAVRVRGDYDPQQEGGEDVIYTPLYFRSVFIINLSNLEIFFQEEYKDEEEYRNLASIAFSPDDKYFVTGALGNIVKVFNLISGECLGKFSSLVWVSDSTGIRDCPLISFLDKNSFVYVNKNSDIVKVSLQENGKFEQTGIIKTRVLEDYKISRRIYDEWKYIKKIELEEDEIICSLVGNYKNYQGWRRFKLKFDDIIKTRVKSCF